MIIKDALHEVESSSHPIAKAIHKSDTFKVIIIAFKKGMILKDHKANLPTKLTILKGKVIYVNGQSNITLNEYDEFNIPISEIHRIDALEDSLCLLTQG